MPSKARSHKPRGSTAREHVSHQQQRANKEKRKLYNYAWEKASKAFLDENPYCDECKEEGKPLHRCLATLVDHIVPHKGNLKLFWDKSNWQSMCTTHHNQKTAREDGGFGNQIKD